MRSHLLLLAFVSCAAPPSSDLVTLFPNSATTVRQSAIGGSGEITVTANEIELEPGQPLTGIVFDAGIPLPEYELEVDAARLAGSDFFCALTFPVADSFATIVLGGWGGSLVGLSCINGLDASQNETKSFRRFDRDVVYTLRVRVTRDRVFATVTDPRDDFGPRPIIDLPLAGKTLSLRPEVEPCKPLGIASYTTRALIRRVAYRPILDPH
jgi:hypothetical protein